MRIKFLIIPTVLLFQAANAQNGTGSHTLSETTITPPAATSTSTPESPTPMATSTSTQTSYLDYKSVYESPTVEDEVKVATERFQLSTDQQEIWLTAATERRQAEKQANEKLNSTKTTNYDKDGVYRGLRTAHNNFFDAINGFLAPSQKQAFETDRLILVERQQRILKLPPPPPPTVTVAPVDSAAIKEAEKSKAKDKKSKKKKKAVAQ